MAQIKKNLTSKNQGPETGKATSTKPETGKTGQTKGASGSVFSRLSEPTISSAQKTVKADQTKAANGPGGKGKPAVNGKGSAGKASSKDSLSSGKRQDKGKEDKKDKLGRKNSAEDKPSHKTNGHCESDTESVHSNNSNSNSLETFQELEAVQNSEGDLFVSICPKEDREIVTISRVPASYSEKEEPFHNTYPSQSKTEFDTVQNIGTDRGQFSDNRDLFENVCQPHEEVNASAQLATEISLKDRLFNSANLTSATMATADPQVENPSEVAPSMEFIIISNGKVKYINTNYKKTGHKMYDYKCDIKLKVDDENFKAHREVLSEASDYFSAMFSHDMKEKEQDVIELKEISPKGFSAILDYFYHGHVTIEPGNVEGVLEAARFFHVDWLLEICCDFLIRHLSLENYTDVINLQDKYWLGDLRWDIFRFLGQNLAELSQQENFLENLSLELLLQFLMENIYTEPSEYFILDLVLKWVKCDQENRKEHLLSLLRQIRFPVLELEELESIPEEVLQFPEMKEAVEDAMNYCLNLMGQCMKRGEMYQQRGARPVLTIMSFTNEANILVYRDPTRAGLFVEELGPTGLDTGSYQAMGQARIGNFLYAAGGYDDQYCSVSRVFRFDPKYREWTEVAPMIQSRVSFAMCNSDNHLFVVGGVHHVIDEEGAESEQVLGSVEMYNPEDNSWRNLQDIPVKASIQAAAVANGCLYVTGGISSDPDDPVPLNTTWCLQIDGAEGWVPKPNMLNGRHGHSLSLSNNKLYAVGGYTVKEDRITFKDQVNNEVFDLETGQWTEIAPTPDQFGHLYPYAEVLYDQLFVIGGIHVNANLYVYDPESDSWEECEVIGPNVQKLAALDVAYPYTDIAN